MGKVINIKAAEPHPLTTIVKTEDKLLKLVAGGMSPEEAHKEIEACLFMVRALHEKLEPALPEVWPRGNVKLKAAKPF